jgi:hypothetical protein
MDLKRKKRKKIEEGQSLEFQEGKSVERDQICVRETS